MKIKMYLRHRTTSIDAVRAINIHFGLRSGINGETPYIKDGNWWVGGSDTGVSAKGRDGDPGATPEIKDDTWWINGVDTGVSAMGLPNYIHPDNPNIRHVTDAEKEAWNGKADETDIATGNEKTLAAAKSYTDQKVADFVNSAPETLDTLQELAEALGNDPNFATTVMQTVGQKVDKVAGKGLSTNDFTAEDKKQVGTISSKQDALALAPATTSMTIVGGKKYYYTGTTAITVGGVSGFTDTADCAMLTVPGNVSVTFGTGFKAVKDMSTVTGTSAQYKIYTIQMAPTSDSGNIYVVSCALYG